MFARHDVPDPAPDAEFVLAEGPAIPTRLVRRLPWLSQVAAAPTVPWGLKTAILVPVAAMAALYVAAIVVLLPIFSIDRHWTIHHPFANALLSPQIEVLAFAPCIVWLVARRFRVGTGSLGLVTVPWRVAGLGIAGFVVSYGLSIVVAILFSLLFPHFLQSNVQQTFGPLRAVSFWQALLLFFAISVEVPLIEELLFRGVVFAGLRHFFGKHLPSSWAVFAAATASAVIFALAHFEPHSAPSLFVLGLVLAYVYEYSGSIYVSAITHGMQNLVALVVYLSLIGHQ